MNDKGDFPVQISYDFIHSLLFGGNERDRWTAPDGVVDLSDLALPLGFITRNGRALRSYDDFALSEFLGNVLDQFITSDCTAEDLEKAVITLTLFIAKILRAVNSLDPSLLPEELMLDVAGQDEIAALARELSAVPYRTEKDGRIVPDFGGLPLLADPFTLTPAAVAGFARRRLRFQTGPATGDEDIAGGDPNDLPDPEYVDEVDELSVADAMNGFDDLIEAADDEDNDSY